MREEEENLKKKIQKMNKWNRAKRIEQKFILNVLRTAG